MFDAVASFVPPASNASSMNPPEAGHWVRLVFGVLNPERSMPTKDEESDVEILILNFWVAEV